MKELTLMIATLTALICGALLDHFVVHKNETSKVQGCRPPVDQGEKLIVTLYEKDGGLHELCSYYPVTTQKGSKDLKDWKRTL